MRCDDHWCSFEFDGGHIWWRHTGDELSVCLSLYIIHFSLARHKSQKQLLLLLDAIDGRKWTMRNGIGRGGLSPMADCLTEGLLYCVCLLQLVTMIF